MSAANINPGIKIGLKQPYTIMHEGRIFFCSHDQGTNEISWNMFMDDPELKEKLEKILKSYLTKQ